MSQFQGIIFRLSKYVSPSYCEKPQRKHLKSCSSALNIQKLSREDSWKTRAGLCYAEAQKRMLHRAQPLRKSSRFFSRMNKNMLQSLEQPSASPHAAVLSLIGRRRELGPSRRVGWICYRFLFIRIFKYSQKKFF